MTAIVSCPECQAPIGTRGLARHRGRMRCLAVVVTRDLLRRGFARAPGWPFYFVLPKAGIDTVKGYYADPDGDRIWTGKYYANRHTWGPSWAVAIVRVLEGRVSTSEMIRILSLAKEHGPDDLTVRSELALVALGR
jgi:hypothetical protein